MARKVIIVSSVGGLKSAAIVTGTFYAAKTLGFEIIGCVGSSGGSIPLPFLCNEIPIYDFVEAISLIDGPKLLDSTATQTVIDWTRNKLGFPRKGAKPMLGLYSGKYLTKTLHSLCNQFHCETFEQAKIPFAVVATKVSVPKETAQFIENNPANALAFSQKYSKSIVFSSGNVVAPIRASCSIPLVFAPVRINEPDGPAFYVDGGVLSQHPVKEAIDLYGVHDIILADATNDMFEEPFYTEEIDNLIEIVMATVYTAVRENTLSKIREATEILSQENKTILRFKPKVKLGMTETHHFFNAVDQIYKDALIKLKELRK